MNAVMVRPWKTVRRCFWISNPTVWILRRHAFYNTSVGVKSPGWKSLSSSISTFQESFAQRSSPENLQLQFRTPSTGVWLRGAPTSATR
eukprot:4768308-Pyramimonas_sp.AAC.1